MNPQEEQPHTPNTHPDSALTVMQEGERVIFDLKRHPIGLIYVYLTGLILVAATAFLIFVLLPGIGLNQNQVDAIAVAVLSVVVVLYLIYSFIATTVYWGNRWIVTSDSLTQVTQTGLFHKESSQLSLENVEDVTAEQYGPLTHIFGYGTIRVQSAGEKTRFAFQYCPNPTYYAQQVLAAREAMAAGKHYHNQPNEHYDNSPEG